MDLKQLRYFSAVVEQGSISAAARALFMSQPPLSTQVRQLEKGAGGSAVRPGGAQADPDPPPGSCFTTVPRGFWTSAHSVESELRAFGRGGSRILRLGAVSSICSSDLPPLAPGLFPGQPWHPAGADRAGYLRPFGKAPGPAAGPGPHPHPLFLRRAGLPGGAAGKDDGPGGTAVFPGRGARGEADGDGAGEPTADRLPAVDAAAGRPDAAGRPGPRLFLRL